MATEVILSAEDIQSISLQIAQSALESSGLDDFCRKTAGLMEMYHPVSDFILVIATGDERHLSHLYSIGTQKKAKSSYHGKNFQNSLAYPLCKQALESNEPILIDTSSFAAVAAQHPDFEPLSESLISWVAVPLVNSSDGIGVLVIECDHSCDPFTKKSIQNVLYFKKAITGAIVQKLRETELKASEEATRAIFNISIMVLSI